MVDKKKRNRAALGAIALFFGRATPSTSPHLQEDKSASQTQGPTRRLFGAAQEAAGVVEGTIEEAGSEAARRRQESAIGSDHEARRRRSEERRGAIHPVEGPHDPPSGRSEEVEKASGRGSDSRRLEAFADRKSVV